ncbi:MAG: hypothetical protein IJG60_06190 [Thermoguttaceae bacterium]|nr:hypothetical protein [Thermoguttaceae bacterium]
MSDPEVPQKNTEQIKPLDDSLLGDSDSLSARKSYFFFRSIFFGCLYAALVFVLLIVLALVGIGIWVKYCQKTISPQASRRAHSVQLSGWLAFNDIQKQTPEVRETLVRKYVNRLDKLEQADYSSPVVVRAIPYIKQAAREYLQKRDEDVVNQELSRKKSTITPPDYKIISTPESGRYILSTEIQPTEALVKTVAEAKNASRSNAHPFARKETQVESNIRTLMKEFFLRQMTRYDRRSDEEKPLFIAESAQIITRFSQIYDRARVELGLPPQGAVEQVRDLNHIIAGWVYTTEPETLARLYWFKDVMVATILADRAGKTLDAVDPLITHAKGDTDKDPMKNAVRGLLGSYLSQKKSNAPAVPEAETPDSEESPEHPSGGEAEDEDEGAEFF